MTHDTIPGGRLERSVLMVLALVPTVAVPRAVTLHIVSLQRLHMAAPRVQRWTDDTVPVAQ